MQGTPASRLKAGAISEAVESGDWPQARLAIAKRLARILDTTDSARDSKTVARELLQTIDRVEQDEALGAAAAPETPLARILAAVDSPESLEAV